MRTWVAWVVLVAIFSIGCEGDDKPTAPTPTGACCLTTGTCAVVTEANCPGIWTAAGVCTPNPCLPTSGACCLANGTCVVTIEANCPGTWTASGVCTPGPCAQPTGSCCSVDGTCVVMIQVACTELWTMFGVCGPNPCLQTGSCCAVDGTCTVTAQAACTALSTWTEAGVCVPNTCQQPPPAQASCCAPDGTCTMTTQANCAWTWTMLEECYPNTCTPTPGACCLTNGICVVTTKANCPGTWTADSVCTPNPCAQPTGSCCSEDGTCIVIIQAACAELWTMFGVCEPNPCPQTGSCCAHDGTCTVTTHANCSGAWATDGGCTPNPCAMTYLSDDFESGDMPTWRNWSCSGTTPNEIGPGFDLAVAGGDSAAEGALGLNLHTDRTYGSIILEPRTAPASGCLEFRFAIRPYLTGEPGTNAQRIYLSEVSMHDHDGPYCLGVTFGRLNGVYAIGAAGSAGSSVATYVPGQWCFVKLHLDTTTDRFDVVVNGPGVVGGHAQLLNLPFAHVLDTVNYVQFWADGNGSNDFGLDSIVLEDDACPPVPVENTSKGGLKRLYRGR